MKKYLILPLFLIGLFSCGNRQTISTAIDSDTPSASTNTEQRDSLISEFENAKPYPVGSGIAVANPIFVDTLVGSFHLCYKWVPNDIVIIRHDSIKYADNSLYLDVDFQGEKIMNNHEFRTPNFSQVIEIGNSPEYELWKPTIQNVTDSCINLNIGFWMPDTDIGYLIELTIFNNGSFSYRELVQEDSE